MSTAIKVENLSKKYIIGHQKQEKYTALRDVIANGAKGLSRKLFHSITGKQTQDQEPALEEFWALDDVSFEIKHGERVGIIGRNGAGKSTLLKVLSRITEPTSGRVSINGRVASLLEVGTGFHPELTGRENIYLNGAILGMSKADIKKNFDEIVAFSEVEKFLDTPVKRYSSGMYVRLAFAVAAHLEPEILIVDEVLAVGDAQFQKKCLGKMDAVSREGRTVLFVSHNMAAIEALCETGIHLHAGRMVGRGNVFDQIEAYTKVVSQQSDAQLKSACMLGEGVNLIRFEISPNPVESGQEVDFELEITASHSLTVDSVVILFYSTMGGRVAVVDLRQPESGYRLDERTPLKLRGTIKSIPFVEGEYSAGIFFASAKVTNNYLNLINLTVLPKKVIGGVIPYPSNVRGLVELSYIFSCP
jgi:lipopolysaccharide transport system ATP-binding protein